MKYCIFTNCGKGRQKNEDSLLLLAPGVKKSVCAETINHESGAFYGKFFSLVSDGMGGMPMVI